MLSDELLLLKRFVYKLTSVFRNDKSIRMLRQILKMCLKLIDMKIIDTIENLEEQHTAPKPHSLSYVPPKSKFEYTLVRLQGATKLLAQILCYCQHSGRLIIPKMHMGHFISICVISMSLTSRIWGLSLSLVCLMKDLYLEVHKMYISGFLPESKVDFLPESYKVPDNLEDWLSADETLRDVFQLLKTKPDSKSQVGKKTDKAEIWPSLKVDGDDLDALNELKMLLVQSSNKGSTALDEISLQSDLGEPVSRKHVIPLTKKQKKKAKRRKVDHDSK